MEQDQQHFNKLFYFCIGCVAVGLTFLIALCFIPIPKGSERFADNCQGFFQGSIVTAAMSFLLGGNIPTNKKTETNTPTVTTNSDTTNVNLTPPTETTKN